VPGTQASRTQSNPFKPIQTYSCYFLTPDGFPDHQARLFRGFASKLICAPACHFPLCSFTAQPHHARVLGAFINSGGILLGGVLALVLKKPISDAAQTRVKILLGAFTVAFGLRLTIASLNGTPWQVIRQFTIVLVSMSLGKLCGKLLRLQTLSNAVGRFATRKMATANTAQFDEGFQVASALFCAAPLSILASVEEGLLGFSKLFLVKAVMDGMGTLAFSAVFGWGVTLSAISVLAWQGAIIKFVALAEPSLRHHAQPLIDSILATDGLLVFSVSLIILQLKKVAVAEYLPSLILAPLLTYWFW
jgi:uncharacterized protein